MNRQESSNPSEKQPPTEAAHLIANLELVRHQLTATVQEILDRYAGMDPVDEQGQRLLHSAISDLENVDSRLHRIRNGL